MNKAELLRYLRKLKKSDDTEGAHSDADQALIEFIDDLEISVVYGAIPKWYS